MKLISTKTILIGILLGLTIVIGGNFLLKRESFPYGRSSADIQIKLKERASAAQGLAFTISAGEIEGEAFLTPALTESAGQSLVSSQIVGVTSTFLTSAAPYPGQITSLIDCKAREFVTEQAASIAGMEARQVMAVAGGRRIFGNCAIEDLKYAAGFWAAYDEKRRQVLTVKLFKPISGPDKIDESQQEILRVFQKVINQAGGT